MGFLARFTGNAVQQHDGNAPGKSFRLLKRISKREVSKDVPEKTDNSEDSLHKHFEHSKNIASLNGKRNASSTQMQDSKLSTRQQQASTFKSNLSHHDRRASSISLSRKSTTSVVISPGTALLHTPEPEPSSTGSSSHDSGQTFESFDDQEQSEELVDEVDQTHRVTPSSRRSSLRPTSIVQDVISPMGGVSSLHSSLLNALKRPHTADSSKAASIFGDSQDISSPRIAFRKSSASLASVVSSIGTEHTAHAIERLNTATPDTIRNHNISRLSQYKHSCSTPNVNEQNTRIAAKASSLIESDSKHGNSVSSRARKISSSATQKVIGTFQGSIPKRVTSVCTHVRGQSSNGQNALARIDVQDRTRHLVDTISPPPTGLHASQLDMRVQLICTFVERRAKTVFQAGDSYTNVMEQQMQKIELDMQHHMQKQIADGISLGIDFQNLHLASAFIEARRALKIDSNVAKLHALFHLPHTMLSTSETGLGIHCSLVSAIDGKANEECRNRLANLPSSQRRPESLNPAPRRQRKSPKTSNSDSQSQKSCHTSASSSVNDDSENSGESFYSLYRSSSELNSKRLRNESVSSSTMTLSTPNTDDFAMEQQYNDESQESVEILKRYHAACSPQEKIRVKVDCNYEEYCIGQAISNGKTCRSAANDSHSSIASSNPLQVLSPYAFSNSRGSLRGTRSFKGSIHSSHKYREYARSVQHA